MTAQPSSQAEREDVALLPCPFCGGEAYHPVIQGFRRPEVWCRGCEVEMHSGEDGIPEAREMWNTRTAREHATPRSMPEEVVEALREALADLDDARTYNRTEEAYGRIAEVARKLVADADTCDHEWSEVESIFTNEYKTDVRCLKCHCSGERDNVTGSVFWPAT